MRPGRSTAAHKTGHFAELVCSNSFRSDDANTSAIGLLHAEMRRLGSLVMHAGDANKVPAGGALAVDRDNFAAAVTAAIEADPLIEVQREEIHEPPANALVVLQRVMGSIWVPLETAGIVLVVLIFVLLEHEAVRDRFIRIAGGAKTGLVTTFVATKPLEFRTAQGTAVSGR